MLLPVPTPRTWSVNDLVTAALLNTNVRDSVNFLIARPLFSGVQNTAQSIPNNTSTPIAIDTTTVDTYSGHSNVTNNSRYVAQVSGWYLVIGVAAFSPNATGTRFVAVAVNGARASQFINQIPVASGSAGTTPLVVGIIRLNTGDYVEAWCDQGSGGALSLSAGFSSLSVLWVHS